MDLLNSRWQDGAALNELYRQAQPFPYLVMDDFLRPGVLEVARAELLQHPDWYNDDTDYSQGHQVKKWFTPSPSSLELDHSLQQLDQHSPVTLSVLRYLRSDSFLAWVESVTGIPDLRADDDWLGGGVHRVDSGGALDVHVDFNIHWKNQMHRRLNLLIYLNPGWQESWGGALELWDQGLQACQHRIIPVFNRAVLFRITEDAYHGHPDPVRTPDGSARLSLALYYYTQERPDHEKAPQHGVIWQGKMPA